METTDKILVIGDSHVRAFSYNSSFVPLFIGPAAFNNFLTENYAVRIGEKIQKIVPAALACPIMLLFSGDVEHVVRKSTGESEEEYRLLRESADRYCNTISSLMKALPTARFLVSAVMPGRSSIYRKYQLAYNERLANFCRSAGIDFVDVTPEIADAEGLLAKHYKADFAHISYYAVEHYYQRLAERGYLPAKVFYNDFRWSYIYNIETELGPFKIWGDINKDELIIEEHENLPLNDFQARSLLYIELLKKIHSYCKAELKAGTFTIGNCKEGFLAFELEKADAAVTIHAFDFNAERIANAAVVKMLSKGSAVDFYCAVVSEPEVKTCSVAIDFEQATMNDESKLKLFSAYRKSAEYLFLLTANSNADSKLLKKAGFLQTMEINTGGKKIILAAGRIPAALDRHFGNPAAAGDTGFLDKLKKRAGKILRP